MSTRPAPPPTENKLADPRPPTEKAPARRPRRLPAKAVSMLPIVGVTVAALLFTALLVLVRTQWAPLESVDHGIASHLNSAVASHDGVLKVLKGITWLGSDGVLWTVVLAGIVVLLIRRLRPLAIFLAIAGAGALVLDPVLKSLVGRLRPVVAHPVSHGTGNSFPSGHSLGSIVCYGALLLVFLPAVPHRFRRAVTIAVAVLVAAIGTSRLMLGVHYFSDVVGAWSLGIAWLGVTAAAFELGRRQTGLRVTRPLTEGLEPEAAHDLEPAEIDPATPQHPARIAAGLVVAFVLTAGAVVGFGELVTRGTNGNGSLLGDHAIPHWFAAHRTSSRNSLSAVFSTMGATQAILIVAILTCVLAVAITRRWRPPIFIATLLFGELFLFLIAQVIIKRPRPDVPHLDAHLPTSSYPSGHVAATLCLYVGIAILVFGHTRSWWRWLFLIPAVLMPVLVAASRMYRGMHHPTDVLGAVVLAGVWLPAVYLMIRPNSGHQPKEAP